MQSLKCVYFCCVGNTTTERGTDWHLQLRPASLSSAERQQALLRKHSAGKCGCVRVICCASRVSMQGCRIIQPIRGTVRAKKSFAAYLQNQTPATQ